MTRADIYTWRDPSWKSLDPIGFEVIAIDGPIGKVDEETMRGNGDLLVVDTGPMIFGEKVVVPVGLVVAVDLDGGRLFVECTKHEITTGPKFADDRLRDERFRAEVGRHFGNRRAPIAPSERR